MPFINRGKWSSCGTAQAASRGLRWLRVDAVRASTPEHGEQPLITGVQKAASEGMPVVLYFPGSLLVASSVRPSPAHDTLSAFTA
ncbi:hypothetical protein EYF80_038904 [Liparis tanakae]|uniref:Uncharacterized protein n=1 Tax=Liparis tanakae TaxID=230148 RepID=A0A4Z2GC98_9TELE|nr:hypothetical protein EYF80_038904 [Liparis tanakae]